MSAIDESLWCGFDDSGSTYPYGIRRYNIADGVWNLVTEATVWNSYSTVGATWDGAYHLYVHHTHSAVEYKKRINLFDESLEDYPFTHGWTDTPKGMTQDFHQGIIIGGGPTFGAMYSYATKQLGNLPSNSPNDATGYSFCVIPPWATNQPGELFTIEDGTGTSFWSYSWSTGWASETVLLQNPSGGGMVWADGSGTEYIYYASSTSAFDKYNVNTGVWSNIGSLPGNHNGIYSANDLTWDGDNYLYHINLADDTIYRFNLTSEAWTEYLNYPVDMNAGKTFIVYTPRIRFMFLDQDGQLLDSPMSLGSVPKDRISTGIKYYMRALEAEGGTVTLGIISDARTDADDILQIAPDSSGSPGTWGSSASLGTFSEGEETPFWLRCNPGAGTTQEAKIARLQLSIT